MGCGCNKSLRICTGDCGEGLGSYCEAILNSLGSPKDCSGQSIIDLLCYIVNNLPIGTDLTEIINLLNQILNNLPIGRDTCTATGKYEESGFVSYGYDEPVRITGINAHYIEEPDAHRGIIVDIGTQDTSGGFALLYRLVSGNKSPGTGVADFQTVFTYPLLVNPPTGERVLVHAYEVGADVSTGVPLNVFTCIEPQ